jgi:hypothetical protein
LIRRGGVPPGAAANNSIVGMGVSKPYYYVRKNLIVIGKTERSAKIPGFLAITCDS